MNERVLLIILLMTPFLIIPVSAAEHTIQFQNHCSYDVAVSIVGGLQYKPAGSTMVYSACQCMADTTCVPTTMCNYTACGTNNMNKCDQGTPLVDNGGFLLDADTRAGAQTTHTISVPKFWQGSFQPRSNCHNDSAGNYVCDYEQHTCRAYQDGQGKIQCGGHGITDAIKGEINFDENGVDTYDVSAVDGFNIPVTIELVPGTYTAEGLTPAAYA
ncbi:MAG: thaumatin family protein, partial [Methanoregula sp.]